MVFVDAKLFLRSMELGGEGSAGGGGVLDSTITLGKTKGEIDLRGWVEGGGWGGGGKCWNTC